ncbi:MAG: SecDF P1 head subdomain-containing protein, partial [Rhodospirillaceae bacterium]
MSLRYGLWKSLLVLACVMAGIVFSMPNLIRDQAANLPDWLQPVTLGLDLQGGSYLLLQVESEAVLAENLESLVESARTSLRQERIRYLDLGVTGQSVTVTIPQEAQQADALRLLRDLDPQAIVETVGSSGYRISYSEEAVLERRLQAVQQSIEIVRRRVDETGTREPTIQRQGQDRIIVELPGVDDPDRIKALIGRTAKLTFHLLDTSVSPEDAERNRIPPASRKLFSADRGTPGEPDYYVVRKRVEVGGDRLTNAQPTFQDGQPVVSFAFDTAGGRRFAQAKLHEVWSDVCDII